MHSLVNARLQSEHVLISLIYAHDLGDEHSIYAWQKIETKRKKRCIDLFFEIANPLSQVYFINIYILKFTYLFFSLFQIYLFHFVTLFALYFSVSDSQIIQNLKEKRVRVKNIVNHGKRKWIQILKRLQLPKRQRHRL